MEEHDVETVDLPDASNKALVKLKNLWLTLRNNPLLMLGAILILVGTSTLLFSAATNEDFNGWISQKESEPTQSVVVEEDVTSPQISIQMPIEGSEVVGEIVVSGSANDDTSPETVQYRFASTSWGMAQETQNWSGELDSTTVTNGSIKIIAKATDTSGIKNSC